MWHTVEELEGDKKERFDGKRQPLSIHASVEGSFDAFYLHGDHHFNLFRPTTNTWAFHFKHRANSKGFGLSEYRTMHAFMDSTQYWSTVALVAVRTAPCKAAAPDIDMMVMNASYSLYVFNFKSSKFKSLRVWMS